MEEDIVSLFQYTWKQWDVTALAGEIVLRKNKDYLEEPVSGCILPCLLKLLSYLLEEGGQICYTSC